MNVLAELFPPAYRSCAHEALVSRLSPLWYVVLTYTLISH